MRQAATGAGRHSARRHAPHIGGARDGAAAARPPDRGRSPIVPALFAGPLVPDLGHTDVAHMD